MGPSPTHLSHEPPVSGRRVAATPAPAAALPFLRGGGAMGALMRGTDWATTPLGPAEAWPQSLKTSVSICLDSAFPVLLWWGPALAMLYNDAYRPLLGDRHPRALGQPGHACWPEPWDTLGPMLHGVLDGGRTRTFEDLMLPLRRRGFPEECYFTFTYSPIRDESGEVGGVFCAVAETTQRVYGARQVACLRDLAAASADARTYAQAAAATEACLSRHARDLPFSALYLGGAGPEFVRAGVTGVGGGAAAPERVAPGAPGPWPVLEVAATRVPAVVEEAPRPGEDPGAPRRTIVLPIPASGARGRPGVLVARLNPLRPLDDGYRGFLDLAARQIGATVASAQASEEERTRTDALAAVDRAKTSFFSNVSHEFRTPLTLILGPVEDGLAAGSLSGPPLEAVHRNARRLLRLVNALLDFAQIEASRAEALFQPTDLAAATADLASNFRSAVERAGLRLVVECPPLPEPVFVDRGMWEKIVLNLLSNAVKFTFDGEIGVRLRAVPGAGVELTIRDTGTGIPAEELPRLFERFHRIRAPRTRSVEGSGIGLALVKELVRLHHGTIEVASAPGAGTTFRVALPGGSTHLDPVAVAAPEGGAAAGTVIRASVAELERWLPEAGTAAAGRPAAPPGRAEGDARGARVLVADDNADMRAYLASILGERWEVEAVPDGAAALEAAFRAPPDLVVADVMMPGLDGFELLRRLRADVRTREIPVMIVSARAGEAARLDGAAARADDYVVKPFSSRELVARAETQLVLGRLRREATRALRDSEARFREIADVVPVALWVTDPSGACTFLNHRWRELTGQDPAAALGLRWLEAVHPDDVAEVRDAFLAASAARAPFRAEFRLRDRDGAFRWVLDLGEPRLGLAGEFLGLVGSVVDITERKAAEDAVRLADRHKSEFLAVLSHELRNPLAPIRNSIVLLGRAPPGSSAAERAREILSRQTDHLARLVDDLLDLTRISRGKVALRRARVDAREVVRRACGDVTGLLRDRGLELGFAEPDAPCWVHADVDRLAQMVGNLVNNAAKFTAAGGRVDVTVTTAGTRCEVRVRDTGVGIAPGDLARIFEPFVQAERTVTQSEGGMGIGLALVRELALAHGGIVRADSQGPGRGAEFVLELPLCAAPAAVTAAPRARGAGRLRVLVVEDNEDAGATLAEVLALDGHEVRVVTTGRQGIDAAFADPPDVLVCDLGLPDLSGHDVVRAVRAGRPGRALFAVALTGRAQPQDRDLALAAGFDAHLAKPPALDALAQLLERAAGQAPAHAAAPAP